MKKKLIIAFAISCFFSGSLIYAQDYNVIVNKSNPVSSLSKSDVSKLFLKKTNEWDNRKEVFPVDQLATSPVREKFSDEIHKKSVSGVKGYWQKIIFSGRGVPPEEISSDDGVINYVKSNPDAIGYVSKSTILKDVKVLKIKD